MIGPPYLVLSVTDVGHDQGGQVRVRWRHEENDQAGAATPIMQYSVWRRVDANLKGGAAGQVPPEFRTMTYPPGTWDYVTSVPAGGEDTYGTVCPSLCDSSVVDGMCWSVYFVRAHTAQPIVFFDTLPDSGYSVDNIAPAAPAGLRLEAGDVLTWQEPTDPDFQYFTVYGSAVDHLDGSETVVDRTTNTSLGIGGQGFAHFFVTATDSHGNEGRAAALFALSGVPGAQPTSFALYPCAPNPFNPVTTIRFDLPQAVPVSVRVYDIAGRLVQTLVDNVVMEAGRREVVWRGCDESGRQVATGTYFLSDGGGGSSGDGEDDFGEVRLEGSGLGLGLQVARGFWLWVYTRSKQNRQIQLGVAQSQRRSTQLWSTRGSSVFDGPLHSVYST
ncbi:MAG: hypothetical protein IPP62_17970 [bacterium]|nr:hypothetical protein [bacterium]